MTAGTSNHSRVLALDPTHRGFGFVVLEGPSNLIDRGIKAVRNGKHRATLKKVAALLRHYSPETLLIEDARAPGSRRSLGVCRLLDSIGKVAKNNRVKARMISRAQILKVFLGSGARTKYEIACAIAEQLPELSSQLPRRRKPYMTEDYRMGIFDAAALGLTYYVLRRLGRHHNSLPQVLSELSAA